MNPRLGFILMFEGDARVVSAAIKNVTEFTNVSAVLKNGDTDVTATYVSTSPDKKGNVLISGKIGGQSPIVPGSYRYYISGTYGGKVRTWYWEITVLPKDLSLFSGNDLPLEDYNPLVEEVTVYEGDNFAKELLVPEAEFTTATGSFRLLGQDVTATYCNGSVTVDGDSITTHNIGGAASIPAGDYGYFLTGTYNDGDCVATWYWKVKVLPKQGVLP